MFINGTPGLPFYVVHAKNAGHQVWLIPLPTGTHCPKASALHEEEHLIKMLNIALAFNTSLQKEPSFFVPGRVAIRAKDVCDLLPKIA